MANPLSALQDQLTPIVSGMSDTSDVTLQEVHPFALTQIAAWPETVFETGKMAAKLAGCSTAPGPGHSIVGRNGNLLRIEPLKWWLISQASMGKVPELPAETGPALDLSHSRTWIRVNGSRAVTLLNHFLPIDLRVGAFEQGAVASTAFHHVGVTLWRESAGYSLLLPRSFAASLWEILSESTQQYGLEVNKPPPTEKAKQTSATA